jgi:hypothetical protein
MTRDEEAAFLAPFFEQAKVGGILIVGEIKQALDVRLGRKVALASAYNLLHRHGWRKLAPDKRPPTKPIRPLCRAMVTQEYTSPMLLSRSSMANWTP